MSAALRTQPRDRAQALADAMSAQLGVSSPRVPPPRTHGAAGWASSGLMALTSGWPAMDVTGGADAMMRAAEAFGCPPLGFDMLTERAALRGLHARGDVSCGGSTRLLACADGWIALSLARAADFEMLPALLGRDPESDPWADVAATAAGESAAAFVEHAQALCLAAAAVDAGRTCADAQWRSRGGGWGPRLRRLGCAGRLVGKAPLVIDLSALWAGPLCASLLGLAGARVIKVESAARPDGARYGEARFHDLLNAGKESLVLDFTRAREIAALRRLILAADVVIESARPRAMEQLGLAPEALFTEKPALTWVSVTAYGRTGPWRNRAGYGDDAAAGAGLLAWTEDGAPAFVGDAIADPLTGIAAAAGAFASLGAGGGWLVDASLRETAAFVAASPPLARADVHAAAPRARPVKRRAGAMGAESARLRREFAL